MNHHPTWFVAIGCIHDGSLVEPGWSRSPYPASKLRSLDCVRVTTDVIVLKITRYVRLWSKEERNSDKYDIKTISSSVNKMTSPISPRWWKWFGKERWNFLQWGFHTLMNKRNSWYGDQKSTTTNNKFFPSHHPLTHRCQSWGLEVMTTRFYERGPLGFARGRRRVVKYFYSLPCTGSMFESGDFSREIETFAQNAAQNGNFLWINEYFRVKWLKEHQIIWEICL